MADEITELELLLKEAVSHGASDLHLIANLPPILRVTGEIRSLPYAPLTSESISHLLEPYLEEHHHEMFKQDMRMNFSVSLESVGRFRFNVYLAMSTVGATIRVIPNKIESLVALGLPPIVGSLAHKKSGIIFVTGYTGSGKSTTMASMLEWVNQTGRPGKIITIEDPIETVFKPSRSIFVQREVGVDTPTFDMGILDALRQDPDILCIGEMRDAASIRAALLAAETGHLVLTTLHTRDASKTTQRVLTAVPSSDQDSLREQLSMTLEAVICQELLPRADGRGLVLACEIMIVTPAVRQMIKENKLESINDAIQSGTNVGMISKDSFVRNLLQKNVITKEVALGAVRNPDMLR
ncbi:MAG: PilT/PilU family type 4a pilus ATPase [Elusimicrobiota bacterium]